MKNLLLILLLSLNATLFAQDEKVLIEAFKTGNVDAISKYFDGNVDIKLNGTQNSYSSAQAQMVLKNYFSSNSPKDCSIQHQGTSPEGSKYFIANIVTSSGTFKLYVYIKSGSTSVIREIRIE